MGRRSKGIKSHGRRGPILSLRTFHNWVKRRLLGDVFHRLGRDGTKSVRVLDLAVGKGGDLPKLGRLHRESMRIEEVAAFDVDRESLFGPEGALERYRRSSSGPKCSFYEMDLSVPESLGRMREILGGKKFHIVSCQFAVHYFFKSEETLRAFTSIVSSFLADGGYFVATTMRGGALEEALEANGVFESELFRIAKTENWKDKSGTGKEYTVSLGDANIEKHYFSKGESTEYIVEVGEMTNVLGREGILLENTKCFREWYGEYMQTKEFIGMSDTLKAFSFLNMSVMYRRGVRGAISGFLPIAPPTLRGSRVRFLR